MFSSVQFIGSLVYVKFYREIDELNDTWQLTDVLVWDFTFRLSRVY